MLAPIFFHLLHTVNFCFVSPAAILGYGSYPPNRAKSISQSTDIAGFATRVAKYRISDNSSFFFPPAANLGYGSYPPNRAKRIPQSTDIADFATRVAKYSISDNSQTLRFHDTYLSFEAWMWIVVLLFVDSIWAQLLSKESSLLN